MQLITGGTGYTARAFLDAGEDVVVIRYRTERMPDFVAKESGKRLRVEAADISNPHAAIKIAQNTILPGSFTLLGQRCST